MRAPRFFASSLFYPTYITPAASRSDGGRHLSSGSAPLAFLGEFHHCKSVNSFWSVAGQPAGSSLTLRRCEFCNSRSITLPEDCKARCPLVVARLFSWPHQVSILVGEFADKLVDQIQIRALEEMGLRQVKSACRGAVAQNLKFVVGSTKP